MIAHAGAPGISPARSLASPQEQPLVAVASGTMPSSSTSRAAPSVAATSPAASTSPLRPAAPAPPAPVPLPPAPGAPPVPTTIWPQVGGPGAASVVPSMHVGSPPPLPATPISIDASVALSDATVMVTPPAGSSKVWPTGRAASVSVAVLGVMSSSQV
jgi:hypothetical protein